MYEIKEMLKVNNIKFMHSLKLEHICKVIKLESLCKLVRVPQTQLVNS